MTVYYVKTIDCPRRGSQFFSFLATNNWCIVGIIIEATWGSYRSLVFRIVYAAGGLLLCFVYVAGGLLLLHDVLCTILVSDQG